eukprot:4169668-Prymnesium_polylepis.1
MRRFRPCSPRATRAHFATQKCNGARLWLNIGHRATSRTLKVSVRRCHPQEPPFGPAILRHGRSS